MMRDTVKGWMRSKRRRNGARSDGGCLVGVPHPPEGCEALRRRLGDLEDRLEKTRLALVESRGEVRRLKAAQYDDALLWLCEPGNYALMCEREPDLMRRLERALENSTPIPPSAYSPHTLSPVARVMSEPEGER